MYPDEQMNDKTLSIIIKAQDQASKTMSHVGGKIEALAVTAAKYAKLAAAALGTAGIAATVFGVKSAASFEQTRIGLENMLGSADAAKKVLKEVSVFAAQTPFEFPELAGAVKQLVAFGFTGEDAVKTMKQLGDVSAAVGAPIGDIAYLMGTLRTQGRAFTVDIRQFAQRGIPIYEYLAKTLKTTEANIGELIETGKIGFPEVQKAFEAMTSEGGKFHGAMAAQSKSLSGLYSTLKDNVGLALREMVGITQEGDVKAGSIFDRLRNGATALITQLDKIDWAAVSSRVMAFADSVVAQMRRIAGHVMQAGQSVADWLTPRIQELADIVYQRTAPAIQSLIERFKELPQWAQLAISPLGAFANSGKSAGEFIGMLRDKIVELWQSFMASTPMIIVGQYIQQVLLPALSAIWAAVTQNLIPALGQLWASITRLWNALNPALLVALQVVGAIIGGALLIAVWAITSAINIFVQGLAMTITAISNVINWISNLISWFGNLVGAAKNAIGVVIIIFRNLTPAVKDVIFLIVAIFATLASMVGEAVSGVTAALVRPFRAAYDEIVGIARKIGDVAGNIGGGVSSGAGRVGSWLNPFRAEGGPVSAGQPYIVGEREPELFVPNTSGTILNQRQMAEAGIGGGSTFNFHGNIILNTAQAVDRFADRFEMADFGVGV